MAMIKILKPSVSAKIAAGEVIESPVSVLKELIENAIDAGANSVSINIEKAGKKLIRVVDDGAGMTKEDLSLAIYRYSTSKISDEKDLNYIETYGFRGEALFSIFSVSKILISTYDGKSDTGYTLKAEGGDFNTISISPSAPIKGTTVEVRDIFFNTPARFKFLKSDSYLRSSIIKLVEEFSLILADKKFYLNIDSRDVYNLTPQNSSDVLSRARKILSDDLLNEAICFEENFDKLKIKGFVSNPSNLVSSKNFQYIYVNSRIVESKTVSSAVYKVFEHIRGNKHPLFLIDIEIEPSKIDVNIHPQKKEVRFDDENFVYLCVNKTLEKSIENYSLAKSINLIQNEVKVEDYTPRFSEVTEKKDIVKDFFQSDFIDKMYKNEKNTIWYKPPISFIGQAFSSILIYQSSTSILFVDQHAASERITFEKYLKEFEEKKIRVQNLVIPFEVRIPKSNIEVILEMKDWLMEAGFEINRNGPSSIAVYSVPTAFNLSNKDVEDIFVYLSEVISKPSNISAEMKRDTIAAISCKKSIKFNQIVDSASAINMLEELKDAKDSMHCPHGRTIIVEITKDEFLKKFGRIG